jgi:hypothetical protein
MSPSTLQWTQRKMPSWVGRTGFLVLTCMWLDFASCGGGHCNIEASNYDQSCTVDSDCVALAGRFAVQFGDFCHSGCMCGGDTINKSSVAQYIHDVSMTPLVAHLESCFCPLGLEPCCVNNRCSTTSCPEQPGDAGETPAADAGPPSEPPGSFMCDRNIGPFDAGTDARGPWRWCMPGHAARSRAPEAWSTASPFGPTGGPRC